MVLTGILLRWKRGDSRPRGCLDGAWRRWPGRGSWASAARPRIGSITRGGRRGDGAEGGRPRRPQAASQPPTVGPGGGGVAERPRGPRLRHQSVDLAADRDRHCPADGGALSPGACLAHPAGLAGVAAPAGPPGARAGRGGDPTLARPALAAGKKTRGTGRPG